MSLPPVESSASDVEGLKRASPSPSAVEWGDEEAAETPERAPLTPAEAAALRAQWPQVSHWQMVGVQLVAGALLVALWALWGAAGAWRSALWGVLIAVVPSAVAAWGLTRRPIRQPGALLLSLAMWEAIKVVLAIAMMVAVVKGVRDLNWLAMLVSLIVCLKVYGLALLRRGRKKNQ